MSDDRSQITDLFTQLCEIVAKLRGPDGCPWDREQTRESLLPALIEEVYEAVEAARNKDAIDFCEELGDLLLLVVMHAEIAREAGRFNIANVLAAITQKLIRRHPHVFGSGAAGVSPAEPSPGTAGAIPTTPGAVLKQWEAIKREEKKTDTHYLASLPKALPALARAQKAQEKVARVNFDWAELRDVVAKVDEEVGELKDAINNKDRQRSRREPSDVEGTLANQSVEDEIGDMLFTVVNLARKCGFDAESALQSATNKFVARFNRLEDELRTRGRKLGDVDLAEMDEIWNEIKRTPKPPPHGYGTERPTPNVG